MAAATGDDWREAVTGDGSACVIDVLAQPRAGRTRVVGLHGGRVKIALAAPPVDGAANKVLIAYLADELGVARRAITLVSGASGRRKRVRVEGLEAAQVARQLLGGP